MPAITAKPAPLTNQTTANFSFTGESGATLPLQHRQLGLRGLHFAQDLSGPRSRLAHLPGRGKGRRRQHERGRLVHLDDRPDAAAGPGDLDEADEPVRQRRTVVRIHADRVGRDVPLLARRRAVRGLPESRRLQRPDGRLAHLPGQGPGRRRQRELECDLVHLVDRARRADDHREAGQPDQPDERQSFSFTDSFPGATFQCALDTPTFTACTSPANYSLAVGSHTFQVRAVSGTSQSAAASYTWTIDTTPPAITVTFPVNGGVYNQNGWNNGCSGGAGICGSATDPSGSPPARSRSSSSRAANSGTARRSTAAARSSTTRRRRAAPAQRSPGVTHSRCRRMASTPSTCARPTTRATPPRPARRSSLSFRIDTVKPPKPIFDSTPPNPNSTSTSNFTWHDGESPVTYLCSTENGAFSATVPGRERASAAVQLTAQLCRPDDQQR